MQSFEPTSTENLERAVPLRIGQVESVRRVFSQEDLDRFARLSGDDNPIHTDPAFSARTGFGRTVVHGMLLYGTICGLLGTRLPGPGTWQVEQELIFPTPTYVGEEVTIQLEVVAADEDEGRAELTTVIVRPGGEVACQGRTMVQLPGKKIGFGERVIEPSNAGAGTASFKGLHIGQQASTTRAFRSADLVEYTSLSGDNNPLFAESADTRRTGLAGPPVPGPLLGALFSYLLGTRLPGRGTNYLKQHLSFPKPACLGQQISASVEVVRLRPEKELVNLRTRCIDPAGQIVCVGEALVLVRDMVPGGIHA